jgi:hypothetical protein
MWLGFFQTQHGHKLQGVPAVSCLPEAVPTVDLLIKPFRYWSAVPEMLWLA